MLRAAAAVAREQEDPSRERERATRRIQQLQVSKLDRSPTPGDTSGEDPEEDHQATVSPLNEGQHAFLTSVWDRYQAGETQEWVQRHVHWGLRHRGDLFPFPPLGQQNQEETNPSAAAVDVPQEAAMKPSEEN
jgi:hypothetical protein